MLEILGCIALFIYSVDTVFKIVWKIRKNNGTI